jgi:hypothetical protein
MRCYDHRDQEAVAVCRVCGRGICGTCAVQVGNVLACRNRCEGDAQTIVGHVSPYSKRMPLIVACFLAAMGIAFLAWGALTGELFVLLCGVLASIFGLTSIIAVRRQYAKSTVRLADSTTANPS